MHTDETALWPSLCHTEGLLAEGSIIVICLVHPASTLDSTEAIHALTLLCQTDRDIFVK